MHSSKDEIEVFLPKGRPKLVVLGTMAAINARTINGVPPAGEIFYYNNNRNHFWKVLQHLMSPEREVIRFESIKQKKHYLNKYKIGMLNLVDEIKVKKKDLLDPSDTVLFAANNAKRVKFKQIQKNDARLIKYLGRVPTVFTCREKKGIIDLLKGFCLTNKIDENIIHDIHFLPTPTRCNPKARSEVWRSELNDIFGSRFV